MTKTRKHHPSSKIPPHMVTFCQIQGWFKAMFEKLGWMILAKARGHEYKIVAYKHGVKHLHECIDHLMTELTEADRQHDLKVLKMEVEVLEDFIKKHL